MKKFLFGLIATVMFGFVGNAKSFKNVLENSSSKPPVILTTFEPGSFSAGIFGCWGSGVCRRDIVVSGRSAKSDTEITNNLDGTLTIKFVYSSMSKENQAYYLRRTTFVNDSEFYFNKAEVEGLQLNAGASIKKGEYKCVKTGENLIITIKL